MAVAGQGFEAILPTNHREKKIDMMQAAYILKKFVVNLQKALKEGKAKKKMNFDNLLRKEQRYHCPYCQFITFDWMGKRNRGNPRRVYAGLKNHMSKQHKEKPQLKMRQCLKLAQKKHPQQQATQDSKTRKRKREQKAKAKGIVMLKYACPECGEQFGTIRNAKRISSR